MKRIIFIILGSINICLAYAQSFNGQYISEWQWDMNKNTNLINQLRLELSVPIGKGKDYRGLSSHYIPHHYTDCF